jgi:hypothetical protein
VGRVREPAVTTNEHSAAAYAQRAAEILKAADSSREKMHVLLEGKQEGHNAEHLRTAFVSMQAMATLGQAYAVLANYYQREQWAEQVIRVLTEAKGSGG